jgi:hypothetical protein
MGETARRWGFFGRQIVKDWMELAQNRGNGDSETPGYAVPVQ